MKPSFLPCLCSYLCSQNNRAFNVYFLLLVAHISLVWLLPFFPTQDGPSHIYNLVILRDLLHGGTDWGNYYFCQLLAIPNLGFNLIAYPILNFFSPETTEKLFLTLYIILMCTGVPIFLKSFGKTVFPYAYLVFPVVFNFTLMMGFYSYCIAVPVYLIAFSICFRCRTKSLPIRFLIYNLSGIVVYYMHLVAYGIFVLSLFSMALSDATGLKRKFINVLKVLGLIFPVIINMLIYLLGNSTGYSNATIPVTNTSWMEKLFDLMMFSSVSVSMWQTASGYMLLVVAMTLIEYGIKEYKRATCSGSNIHNCIDSHKLSLMYLEVMLLVICLFAPFRFGEASYFNQRFPWVILLLALPLMRVPISLFSVTFMSRVLVFAAFLSLVVNSITFFQKSRIVESFLGGLSLDIPKGALVLTYENQREGFRTDVLMHAISHYGIRKKIIDIGNYEVQTRLFPIRYKQSLSSLPSYNQTVYSAESIDWERFSAIQYIFAWKQNTSSMGRIVEFYDKIFDNGRLSVWRRM